MTYLKIAALLILLAASLMSLPQKIEAIERNVTQGDDKKAAAQKAWKPFFDEFRIALRKRDRAALKKMMADFNGAETPESVFKQWDNPKVRGWENLNRTLNLGVVPSRQEPSEIDAGEVPDRVAPPAANRNFFRGWLALFKYYGDGKWYFVQFTKFK